MPDRRTVIIGIMATLGGQSAVARAVSGKNDKALLADVAPDGRLSFYTQAEYRTLTSLADVIIPRTDTPGAIDARVPAYLDKMMSTWASAETQSDHRAMLKDVSAQLDEIAGGALMSVPPAARAAAIAALDKEAYASAKPAAPLGGAVAKPQTVGERYRAIKVLIGQVYYTSEPGATVELHYDPVPGQWRPNVPLAEIGRTWAD